MSQNEIKMGVPVPSEVRNTPKPQRESTSGPLKLPPKPTK